MREKECLIVVSLLFVGFSATWLCGGGEGRWTMEFRIAAHPVEEAKLVQSARNSDRSEIYEDGRLVGKWVEAVESVEQHIEVEPNLVTRRNKEGRLELLVRTTAYDLNENDVRRIYASKDRYGRLALTVEFDEEGSSKMFDLTRRYAYRQPGCYVAEIMDGKVHAAVVVVEPVSMYAAIPGDFDESIIEDIKQRSKKGVVARTYPEPRLYPITITPLRLAFFFVVVLTVIVGSLPARGLRRSRFPRTWIAIGVVAGAITGAYKLGVNVTYGSEAIGGGLPVIAETINISIVWFLVGASIGAGCGFVMGLLCRFFVRRAIHNIRAVVFRCGRAVDQGGTAGEGLND